MSACAARFPPNDGLSVTGGGAVCAVRRYSCQSDRIQSYVRSHSQPGGCLDDEEVARRATNTWERRSACQARARLRTTCLLQHYKQCHEIRDPDRDTMSWLSDCSSLRMQSHSISKHRAILQTLIYSLQATGSSSPNFRNSSSLLPSSRLNYKATLPKVFMVLFRNIFLLLTTSSTNWSTRNLCSNVRIATCTYARVSISAGKSWMTTTTSQTTLPTYIY